MGGRDVVCDEIKDRPNLLEKSRVARSGHCSGVQQITKVEVVIVEVLGAKTWRQPHNSTCCWVVDKTGARALIAPCGIGPPLQFACELDGELVCKVPSPKRIRKRQ